MGDSSACKIPALHRVTAQTSFRVQGAPDSMDNEGADGWRTKKRKCHSFPTAVTDLHPINFVFENPLFGAFARMPFTLDLMEKHGDRVFMARTSYCHYGFPYQKATLFVGTLPGFFPPPPCSSNPCLHFRVHGHHASQVKAHSAAEKNSIPHGLVDLEIETWMACFPNPVHQFLFIDCFAGYGSVCDRVRERFPNVKVYANDIVKRKGNDAEIDVEKYDIEFLLNLALKRHFEDAILTNMPCGLVHWLRREKIAVLFHLSTPCNTYSTDGLAHNRDKKTLAPLSDLARKHDTMNINIMKWLRRVCFQEEQAG